MLIPFLDLEIKSEVILTHKGHVAEAKSQKKGQRSCFFHKSITDMSKMSFEGYLGMLIPILNSEIQLEVIRIHKGHSRDR